MDDATRDAPGALFAVPEVVTERRPDGTIYLTSPKPLPAAPRALGDWLERYASDTPEATFLAERAGGEGEWQRLSYAEARARVRAVAGWLLSIGAGPERPLAILSENSVDHAVMALGAMHAGVPAATVSAAYSLMSSDHAKLKAMIGLLKPAAIFVSDETAYARALAALDGVHAAQIVASAPAGRATAVAELADPDPAATEAAFQALTPDTVARLLFTSGSTGTPKAVINTHRMLTSNQMAHRAVFPAIGARPPVLVDWLPWSHTFGANFVFNAALANGGAIYIDAGKPAPHLVHHTIRNIRELRPTVYFNVPRGYELLAEAAEKDADFARAFFSADLMFYAGAALPRSCWDKLLELSAQATGRAVTLVSSWGTTETAPSSTYCHWQAETSGNIGIPNPGTTIKLVPNAGKLEIRVKGPNVTPGYFRNPEKTAEAFDEEGFYKPGDAVRFADPDDPVKGLFFDGRVSEDFKLTSGTWVNVGELRLRGIDALRPLAQDIVVAGEGQDEVGFLIVPAEAAAREIAGTPDAPLEDALADAAVRAHVARGLARLKAEGGGSSRYAARARFTAAPDPDRGEITDKAYMNQRAMLTNRADDLAALFGTDPAGWIAPA
ncbi:feruloyl-CoA synthase [Rhodosalinus halophilus]|uniref:Feruloyl-CoA synthase n=1 Tax=Rhodosalinus halophilus TaxID=2259333 RepID=A0A365UDC0_9RHOB|nr:feruloyl-CoA synthase [Rhodosalinus halophilus]RBI87546.1 feruloyl-CoA synthase [Rhodosalinus halophilus]